MTLEQLGFKLTQSGDNIAEYTKVVDKDFENHVIEINFKNNTINFQAYYPQAESGSKFDSLDVPLEVLEASIDVLNARKVERSYE